MIICNNGDDILEFEALEDEDVEEGEGMVVKRDHRKASTTLKGKGAAPIPASSSSTGT